MCSELHAPRPASMHPTPKQCPGTKNLTLGERDGEVGRGGGKRDGKGTGVGPDMAPMWVYKKAIWSRGMEGIST